MRRPLSILFGLYSIVSIAQVGINTTSPAETLEVNGTFKVSNTTQGTVTTTKMAGLNNAGNLRDIAIGTNLVLKNNVLSSKSAFDHSFGDITSNGSNDKDDVDLLLETGETNEEKSIIRINSNNGDQKFTGIKAGYDGQHIWLSPQDGKLTLKTLDTNSLVANRIEDNNKPGCLVYGMIELVYDGTRNLWIIMQNHQ